MYSPQVDQLLTEYSNYDIFNNLDQVAVWLEEHDCQIISTREQDKTHYTPWVTHKYTRQPLTHKYTRQPLTRKYTRQPKVRLQEVEFIDHCDNRLVLYRPAYQPVQWNRKEFLYFNDYDKKPKKHLSFKNKANFDNRVRNYVLPAPWFDEIILFQVWRNNSLLLFRTFTYTSEFGNFIGQLSPGDDVRISMLNYVPHQMEKCKQILKKHLNS